MDNVTIIQRKVLQAQMVQQYVSYEFICIRIWLYLVECSPLRAVIVVGLVLGLDLMSGW